MLTHLSREPVITTASSIIHKCPTCGWYRALTEDARKRQQSIRSIYGDITMERLAQLDVANHDCEAYRRSRARLARYIRAVKAQEAAIQSEVERMAS